MIGSTFSVARWSVPGLPSLGRKGAKQDQSRRIAAPASATGVAAPDPSAEQPSGDAAGPASPRQPARSLPAWPLLLRTLALHAAHIAARMLARPLQPVTERLDARAAASPAVQSACDRLQVDDLTGLHDVANALVLAECVYRVVDRPESEALCLLSALKAAFPPGLVTLRSAQFARSHVRHRFVVAEGGDAMYVGFMGTKLARDYLTNAAVWQEEVRVDAALLSTDDAERVAAHAFPPPPLSSAEKDASGGGGGAPAPAAHRGFVTRARGIPIDALYQEARARGKRLVLCGHSLGGAVAQLCTLHLLQSLPREEHASVACIGFAAPALGNQALAHLAEESGWDQRMRNYLVPEDPIPHLLSARRPRSSSSVDLAAASEHHPGAASSGGSSPPAPLTPSSSGAEGGTAPASPLGEPHIVLQAANNISAVSRGMLRMSKSQPALGTAAIADEPEAPAGGKQPSVKVLVPANGGHTAAAVGSEVLPGAPKFENSYNGSGDGEEGQRTAAEAPLTRPRRRLGAALSAAAAAPARTAASAALGAARLVAFPLTAPMRAVPTPQYQTLGRQLYITSTAVRSDPGPFPPPTVASPAAAAPSQDTLNGGGWWPWASATSSQRAGASARALGSGSGSLDDDDDNVDVAAATAAAGGIFPDRLPRRTLFPMHRMVTYRNRLLGICQDALGGSTWSSLVTPATAAAVLPHLPNVPHPGDVAPTLLLAPGVFPLRAEACPVDPLPPVDEPETTASAASTSSGQPPPGGSPGPKGQRRRWLWPWHALLRRSGSAADAALVEVMVRIDGRGLSNVTHAWISGACRDGSGRAVPAVAEIVTRPVAPSPWTSVRNSHMPLMAPLSAFASWLALTVGWVALLRRLQPAGRHDYLLARVKLPAGAVREAHLAAVDPLLVAVGEGPKLMVHLQSDFAVQSLPLDIRIGCSAPVGRGGGVGASPVSHLRGGFKDASLFMRQHVAGVAWWRWGAQPEWALNR